MSRPPCRARTSRDGACRIGGLDGAVRCGPRWLAKRLLVLLLALLMALLLAAPAQAALRLDPAVGDHALWPQIAVLDDPTATLDLPTVLQRAAQPGGFDPVGARDANLGRRSGAVWLRAVLQLPPGDAGHWLLLADYPPLDRIDVYLLGGTTAAAPLLQHQVMGDQVPPAERPRPTRSPVAELDLPGGAGEVVLLLRVQTTGSMIVPLALRSAARYEFHEAREQALQGLIAGASLLLLVYSLTQWIALREALFGFYALALVGDTAFFAALSGMGPQHLWSGSAWLSQNAPPFSILLGMCGALLFARRALDLPRHAPWAARLVQLSAGLALLTALAFVLGLSGYATTQAIGMAMGPLPLVVVLPTAWRRARAGERTAALLLLGWGLYAVGALAIVGLLAGWLPVGFWSLHGFQFGTTAEMMTWMAVLAQRVQAVQDRARALQGDRDRLHSLAHTDALTGLLNRRGLEEALPARLAAAEPQSFAALYLLDLDGFKPVNDRLGHQAGDELLVAVGQRLRHQLRTTDLVCRLGGDEFVLVATGFSDAADAQQVGEQVLRAFDAPFPLAAGSCKVGVTIGYALAPQDGTQLQALVERADQALYAGKQAGRGQLRRAA